MSDLFVEAMQGTDGTMLYRLEGILDREGAEFLRDQVRATAAPVTVDFRQVKGVADSALGVLAAGLAGRGNARLVGLSRHGERIVRAFGVAAA